MNTTVRLSALSFLLVPTIASAYLGGFEAGDGYQGMFSSVITSQNIGTDWQDGSGFVPAALGYSAGPPITYFRAGLMSFVTTQEPMEPITADQAGLALTSRITLGSGKPIQAVPSSTMHRTGQTILISSQLTEERRIVVQISWHSAPLMPR